MKIIIDVNDFRRSNKNFNDFYWAYYSTAQLEYLAQLRRDNHYNSDDDITHVSFSSNGFLSISEKS